jgi:multicomponent Na+:H+ antiporter subunit D
MTGVNLYGVHFLHPHFFHPSIAFLAAAVVMAFLSNRHYKIWRWLLLVPPVIAIVAVAAQVAANAGPRQLATLFYLGQGLQL